jgi:hypothetical protein
MLVGFQSGHQQAVTGAHVCETCLANTRFSGMVCINNAHKEDTEQHWAVPWQWLRGKERVSVCWWQVMAPFTPFFCEAMYQNLRRALPDEAPQSVHWCDFPQVPAAQVRQALALCLAVPSMAHLTLSRSWLYYATDIGERASA